jgi:hypothetical protein
MSTSIVKVVLALLCALFCWTADAQTRRECKEFDISYLQVHAVRAEKEAEIRQALWTAFNEGIAKCLLVTWFTKEGDPNTYRYKIQPNSEGRSTISVEITREMRSRGLPSASKRVIRESHVATSMKFTPLASEPGSTRRTAQSDPSLFKRHKLQLLDSRGALIQEI